MPFPPLSASLEGLNSQRTPVAVVPAKQGQQHLIICRVRLFSMPSLGYSHVQPSVYPATTIFTNLISHLVFGHRSPPGISLSKSVVQEPVPE